MTPPRAVGRRRFFSALLGEGLAALDEVRGRPQCRLEDLAGLPDDLLSTVVPSPGPPGSLRCEERQLLRVEPEGPPVVVRAFAPLEQELLGRFHGRRTLGEIADEVARLPEAPPRAEVFACARALFCELAVKLVFVPATPVVAKAPEPAP